jgi:hypothetical protein
MANKVISMQQVRFIIQLLEKKHSFRSIAAQLKLSRQTVTHYAGKIKSSQLSFVELRALNDADLSAVVYPRIEAVGMEQHPPCESSMRRARWP